MLELRSARARHDEVMAQLAALGPDACAAPTAPLASEPTLSPATPVAPAKPPSPPDAIPPRQLRIAGGVTLGLGSIARGRSGVPRATANTPARRPTPPRRPTPRAWSALVRRRGPPRGGTGGLTARQ